MAAPKIVVIDDDHVLRARIIGALRADGSLDVVGEADCLARSAPLIALKPDIVLLDLGLPDGDGGDLIQVIHASGAACKVLVLTVFEDRSSVINAFRQGADGYVLKDTPDDELIRHVRATLAGDTPISARAAGHLLRFVRREEVNASKPSTTEAPALSPREKELLEHLARGASRKEAARLMNISPFTAAEYLQNVYRKLHVKSRAGAVYEALQARLINLEDKPERA